jgi:hypothetical protein
MWFWRQPKLTDLERQGEIARLEAARDSMLESAPRAAVFRRVFIPAAFVLLMTFAGISVATHPGKSPLLNWLVFAVLVFMGGRAVLRIWLHPLPKGDPWSLSDTLQYDGDSPRDVQKKIDALRTESATNDE